MIYVLGFLFLVICGLLTHFLTVKQEDEDGVKLTKLAGLFCLIAIECYVVTNGLVEILGR